MERIRSVVLTGGPSGGKSTLQRAVSEHIPEASCAPEVATIILSGGFPAPTEQHPWDEAWQRRFQSVVAIGQIALEETVHQRAKREGKRLAVFDRGLLDGAAYLPGRISDLEQLTGIPERTMLSNYDLVLHLTTSAAHNAYDKQSNPHRFEEAEEALRLEERVMGAWHNHPNRIVIDNPSKTERVAEGIEIVQAQLTS